MDDLYTQLRQAAAAHQPDRARILARVEQGKTSSSVPTGLATDPARAREVRRSRVTSSRPRIALAALVTAATLAVSGLAVGGVVQNHDRPQEAATLPETSLAPSPGPSPSPTPDISGRPRPSSPSLPSETMRPSPPSPSSTTAHPAGPSAPGRTHTEDGPLWAAGSVDVHSNTFWAQSNVTIKTRKPLTALTLELRVVQTGGVKSTGSWQTLSGDDFALSVREDSGVLVYRWALKPGRTVPVGQHVFAGQYDHAAGGRDAVGDTYRVDAGTADATPSVWGDFPPGA
ncbi:hypothetical protein [Streptomyces sp. NPDC048269]|uniref:hypothetical protein n=1 Tax=Streptomyces sp. NPDC048269 TaxID=3155753 RepID=UPI00342C69E8